MCFVKSSVDKVEVVQQQDPIIRKKADASITKNTNTDRNKSAFLENIKTSAFGLEDETKKTLLGE